VKRPGFDEGLLSFAFYFLSVEEPRRLAPLEVPPDPFAVDVPQLSHGEVLDGSASVIGVAADGGPRSDVAGKHFPDPVVSPETLWVSLADPSISKMTGIKRRQFECLGWLTC
jgi:hypothetical protein